MSMASTSSASRSFTAEGSSLCTVPQEYLLWKARKAYLYTSMTSILASWRGLIWSHKNLWCDFMVPINMGTQADILLHLMAFVVRIRPSFWRHWTLDAPKKQPTIVGCKYERVRTTDRIYLQQNFSYNLSLFLAWNVRSMHVGGTWHLVCWATNQIN